MQTEQQQDQTEAAGGASAVDRCVSGRCMDCLHWQKDENRYNRAIDPEYNPVTGDEWASEEEKRQFFPDTVRYCKHPKVLFYQRPESNGAAVFDGSEYVAYLATGEDFGCVNFEPANDLADLARGP